MPAIQESRQGEFGEAKFSKENFKLFSFAQINNKMNITETIP